MEVKVCPRCGSIDKKGRRQEGGGTEYECQQCGKLFDQWEAEVKTFVGEKKPKVRLPDSDEPWLFEEMA